MHVSYPGFLCEMFLLKAVRTGPCTEIRLAFSVPPAGWRAADEHSAWALLRVSNSPTGLLLRNARLMNLLLAQRWPRKQQWHSTSRFRVNLCFGVCKLRSHNVMKDNKQCFFIMLGCAVEQHNRLGTKTQPSRANAVCCTLETGSSELVGSAGVLASSGYFNACVWKTDLVQCNQRASNENES